MTDKNGLQTATAEVTTQWNRPDGPRVPVDETGTSIDPTRTPAAAPENHAISAGPVDTVQQTDDERFVDSILASNPFQRVRITDPKHIEFDVPSIHAQAYARIIRAADQSLSVAREALKWPERSPQLVPESGLLLLGDAGVGKSHLLARVGRTFQQAGDGFVYLHNIHVRPNDLPRYVLKCFVNSLAFDRRDNFHHTPLYKLVDFAIRNAAQVTGIPQVTKANLSQAIVEFARYLQGDETVFRVIFHFYYHSRRQLEAEGDQARTHAESAAIAARWLKGDLVESQHANRIGILAKRSEELLELADHQINDAIVTIARLAAVSNRRCVLCFDQCENISPESLTKLAQFVQGLVDHPTPTNLVSIVAGVRAELLASLDQQVISTAAAARLNAAQPIELRFLTRDEAKTLIHDRVHEFFERIPDLPAAAKPFFRNDSLFPLGEAWLAETMGTSVEFRPRDLMVQANDRWHQNQQAILQKGAASWLKDWPRLVDSLAEDSRVIISPESMDSEILAKVEEAKNRQLLQPGLLPPDGGNLQGILTELLNYCRDSAHGYSLQSVAPGKHADELVVMEQAQGKTVCNRIKIVVTGSSISAASRLRQLINAPSNERRILVTDQRCELALGAAGNSYYQQLQSLNDDFRHYKLSLAEYAELHAMLAVIGEANSGDLSARESDRAWRAITPQDVVDCFHRNDRFRNQHLLAELLSEPTTEVVVAPLPFDDVGFRTFVCSRLALLMGANLSELLRRFAIECQLSSTLDELMPRARDVVMQMHSEELVVATPWDNDLFLMVRPAN